MRGIGAVVLGALAVFALVVGWLLVEGRRTYRRRQARRASLGLVRVTTPDPALTARILAAFPAATDGGHVTLSGLERLTTDEPGAWYVAMVKQPPGADAPGSTHVLLVIDALPQVDGSSEPTAIAGTNGVWTRRALSGLLLVESVADAGEAARDFERMRKAGAQAVAAARTQ